MDVLQSPSVIDENFFSELDMLSSNMSVVAKNAN